MISEAGIQKKQWWYWMNQKTEVEEYASGRRKLTVEKDMKYTDIIHV